MKEPNNIRRSERGSAAVKALFVFIVLALAGHAGLQYVPVAYNGASFREGMDTAVVKGLATSGRMKPLDVVTASVNKAMRECDIPEDAEVEIKPEGGVIQAHVIYTQDVNILPFGLYKYKYNFDYLARPTGYLLKDSK
jgi:hypothetical protein